MWVSLSLSLATGQFFRSPCRQPPIASHILRRVRCTSPFLEPPPGNSSTWRCRPEELSDGLACDPALASESLYTFLRPPLRFPSNTQAASKPRAQ